jgi:diguanylate cyclase (GGDEF)-like protein
MTRDGGNQDGDQALRLRRSLVAFGGCAGFVCIAGAGFRAGLVQLSPSAFGLLFGGWLAIAGVFSLVIRSGRNRHLADPAMTVPQVLWASLGPVVLYPFAPELMQVSHMGLLAIGLFGAFGLGRRRYLLVNILLLVALGIAFVARQMLQADADSGSALLGFSAFALALSCITFVGFELGSVRRTLGARNEDLVHALEKLREMTIRDELTGLHNRRHLMEVLTRQMAEARRDSGHRFALCFVDLDHFKRVNDVFGHGQGDEILKRFADIAREAVREIDYVVRLGGEEFVVVLVGAGEDDGRLVAERIRHQLSSLSVSERIPDFRISASFGVTDYRTGEDIETTLSRADHALYEAKRGGRDRVVVAAADASRAFAGGTSGAGA